ncbi:MAG: hypothetical protein ABIS06_05425 [Vicinamibacterales bacterium]
MKRLGALTDQAMAQVLDGLQQCSRSNHAACISVYEDEVH